MTVWSMAMWRHPPSCLTRSSDPPVYLWPCPRVVGEGGVHALPAARPSIVTPSRGRLPRGGRPFPAGGPPLGRRERQPGDGTRTPGLAPACSFGRRQAVTDLAEPAVASAGPRLVRVGASRGITARR